MILLDASALVAFLSGERAANMVASILTEGDAAVVSTNLAECMDVVIRALGYDQHEVEGTLAGLLTSSLRVVPVGEAEARKGSLIRATRYHGRRAPLSMADCHLIAAAVLLGASIATTDAVLGEVARQEGVEVDLLPAARPRRS